MQILLRCKLERDVEAFKELNLRLKSSPLWWMYNTRHEIALHNGPLLSSLVVSKRKTFVFNITKP